MKKINDSNGVSVIIGALMLILIVVALSAGFFAFAAQQQEATQELQLFLKEKETESLDITKMQVTYNNLFKPVNVSVWVSANWSGNILDQSAISEIRLNGYLKKNDGENTGYSQNFTDKESKSIKKKQTEMYQFDILNYDPAYQQIFWETSEIGDAITVTIRTEEYGNIFEKTFYSPTPIIEINEDIDKNVISFDASQSYIRGKSYIDQYNWIIIKQDETVNTDEYLFNITRDYTKKPQHNDSKVYKTINETGDPSKYIIFADEDNDEQFNMSKGKDIILCNNNSADDSVVYNEPQFNTSSSSSENLYYAGDEEKGFIYYKSEDTNFEGEKIQFTTFEAVDIIWVLLEIKDTNGLINHLSEEFIYQSNSIKTSLEDIEIINVEPQYDAENNYIINIAEIETKNNAGFQTNIEYVKINGNNWNVTEELVIDDYTTKILTNNSWNIQIPNQHPIIIKVHTTLNNDFQQIFYPPTANFVIYFETIQTGQNDWSNVPFLDATSTDQFGDSFITNWDWNITWNETNEFYYIDFNTSGDFDDSDDIFSDEIFEGNYKFAVNITQGNFTYLDINNNSIYDNKTEFCLNLSNPINESNVTSVSSYPILPGENITQHFQLYSGRKIQSDILETPGLYDVTLVVTNNFNLKSKKTITYSP